MLVWPITYVLYIKIELLFGEAKDDFDCCFKWEIIKNLENTNEVDYFIEDVGHYFDKIIFMPSSLFLCLLSIHHEKKLKQNFLNFNKKNHLFLFYTRFDHNVNLFHL